MPFWPLSPGLQKSADGPSPTGIEQGLFMKSVNLALDILFRTLDTIDAVRDRMMMSWAKNPTRAWQ